jgi:predicted Rossmann-fold nucleotide-binding protein
MKGEVDSPEALQRWLAEPHRAVFQGLDLRDVDEQMAAAMVAECTFLGCLLGDHTVLAAAHHAAVVVPSTTTLPFHVFRHSLYSPDELYDVVDERGRVDPSRCLDHLIYASYADPTTRSPREVDLETIVMRRLHDTAITDALDEFLATEVRVRCVAVMGGHDARRDEEIYVQVAELAQQLAGTGTMVLTGGGPGLMEAANLGAYTAGFDDPAAALSCVLGDCAGAPSYEDPDWLPTAFAARRSLGTPQQPAVSRNVGIPTWFYGHEPPNVFATHVAKYFENSVREDGLLALAQGGMIIAPGNAGTVQEIFQDACQNYYTTFTYRSPMVLLGRRYWTEELPAWPLLQRLAARKGFDDLLLLTDDPAEVPAFLAAHPPRR